MRGLEEHLVAHLGQRGPAELVADEVHGRSAVELGAPLDLSLDLGEPVGELSPP